ncbi:MAG TPA: 3-phosphoglycerate dehydrogenase [Bacteroidales bacterium]|nr:3-phosphoglycerate dehydrogenase [Bacteroidales bacterium]
MKIVIATEKPFASAAVDGIREVLDKAGYELSLLEGYTDRQELLGAVKDADALIVRSDIVDKEVINNAENLKIVVRAGAGYDNIDLDACTAGNIVAMNTPGQNSNAVAELAFGMMVYLARGGYNGKPGTELKGKTLGIHAYGNVGKCVAKIAKGFGMDIYAFDPYIDASELEKDGVKVMTTVEDLYSASQYVSIHIPANDQTKGSIGYKLISLMPANAVLVNTARKEVIKEEELLKAFNERNDFSYISDIAPDCRNTIESNYEGRYFFTPKKMGAQTAEANINAGVAAASQIVAFLEKGDETFRVNK